MSENPLIAALPVALAIIMLGLGLSLTVADFKRIAVAPRAVLVGLFCQTLLLPVACFLIARSFHLGGALAVGLMLLAASPGGASANLFSHLARGDVALNITLTAVNSVVSLVTLPLIVGVSLNTFMAEDRTVSLGFAKVAQVFAIVLVPVVLGMLLRVKREAFAKRLDRPVRIMSAVFLAVMVLGALVKERSTLGRYLVEVGGAVVAFNLLSLAVGYFVPRLFRVERRQSVAIGMEIGVHNGTLAITLASSPLLLNNNEMAVPAAMYSVVMFVTAAAFAFLMARLSRPAAERPEIAATASASVVRTA
jgi:BASS family bile acid:Na+ symporter